MFILKGILRAESQEKILIYLMLKDKGYGKSIADFFSVALNPIQKQLARMEADGVVVSQLIGNVRMFELNPRYPFIESLKTLLKSAINAYPAELVNELVVGRNRPRQPGKPVKLVRDRKSQEVN